MHSNFQRFGRGGGPAEAEIFLREFRGAVAYLGDGYLRGLLHDADARAALLEGFSELGGDPADLAKLL